MKARIADELARNDLTSQIAYAINDAIAAYQDERYYFNETRAITFPTVQAQEFYGPSVNTAIADIQKIDYVALYIGNTPFMLEPMAPAVIESASTNATATGQPGAYCYYAEQFRLYPVPAESNWLIRIGASIKRAAPVTNNEANNVWMTKAERLIRARAKLEIAIHVLHDPELAETMTAVIREAEEQLISRTAQLTQHGQGRVTSMQF